LEFVATLTLFAIVLETIGLADVAAAETVGIT